MLLADLPLSKSHLHSLAKHFNGQVLIYLQMISFFWENIEKSRLIQCCLLLVRLFLHDKMPPQYGVQHIQLDAQIETRALLSPRLDPFSESRNLASDAFNNEQQSTLELLQP